MDHIPIIIIVTGLVWGSIWAYLVVFIWFLYHSFWGDRQFFTGQIRALFIGLLIGFVIWVCAMYWHYYDSIYPSYKHWPWCWWSCV